MQPSKTKIMFKNFSIVPKFFILLLDLGATLLALFIAILIQYNVSVKLVNWNNVLNAVVLITLINSLVFILTKSYTSMKVCRKGRLKRKIQKRILKLNRITD